GDPPPHAFPSTSLPSLLPPAPRFAPLPDILDPLLSLHRTDNSTGKPAPPRSFPCRALRSGDLHFGSLQFALSTVISDGSAPSSRRRGGLRRAYRRRGRGGHPAVAIFSFARQYVLADFFQFFVLRRSCLLTKGSSSRRGFRGVLELKGVQRSHLRHNLVTLL
ncbi:hypothetical protein EJB05_29528, partial [Eragrostis curvula]